MIKIYLINNIAILSHLLNTLTGGAHTNSFSARVGYAANVLKKPWAIKAEKLINKIPFFSDNHCFNEYRNEFK